MPKRARDDSSTREAIAAIFAEHNPEKLEKLDELIDKYSAAKLLELVTKKYQPSAAQEESESDDEPGAGDEEAAADGDDDDDDEITPLMQQALALRGSASTEEDLAAYEAALRRTLDASVESPPSTAAAAQSAMSALR